MNDEIRKTLPLVGALALVASTMTAGTGAALGAKPEPVIVSNGGDCVESGTDFRYFATANLSANKGRWIFIETMFDGVVQESSHKVETGFETVEFYGDGDPATITVTVTTRKGVATKAMLEVPLTCPVGR